MKLLKRLFILFCCSLPMIIAFSGCSWTAGAAFQADHEGMTNKERTEILATKTDVGDKITLYDEEIDDVFEIHLIKSASFDAAKEASFYLIQGNIFNDTQLTALKDYLYSNAPQTLLAVINNDPARKGSTEDKRDFVKGARAYQAFITDDLLRWIGEKYKINSNDICFVGYDTAGYFAAYLLYSGSSIAKYIMINPKLQYKTNRLDMVKRENKHFTQGKTTLSADLCLLRSEDDQQMVPFLRTEAWINSLIAHGYRELTLNDVIVAGGGHNVIDCEALLRGICYFSNKEYGDREAACVVASKAMTKTEKERLIVRKLSSDHEYYSKVLAIDPEAADYIQELELYDEEINDRFVIHISLPPNYSKTEHYPLVLMTDGVWRLSNHPELRKLMVSGEIENVILVSVGYRNGDDYYNLRARDFMDQPDLFLQFIVENVIPYLCDHYCVDTSKITLTGHSNGGYWGFYSLFHSDTIGRNTFANYYIGSPTFSANTNMVYLSDFEAWFFNRKQTLDCSVYVTAGSEEGSPFLDEIQKNLNQITKRSYQGLSLEYEVMEGCSHSSVFKPSIKKALIKFYGSK